MLQKPWQENLQADLKRLQKPDRPPRLAVLGIGHELYGDDAVGVWLAGRLGRLAHSNESLLAVQGGPAPENFTGTLRRFGPDLVLMVDAALMDLEPGKTGWLSWQDTTGFSASTHTLPLHLLAGLPDGGIELRSGPARHPTGADPGWRTALARGAGSCRRHSQEYQRDSGNIRKIVI